MRTVGATQVVKDLRTHDHACWVFDEGEVFLRAAMEFLADGLVRGERVGYIGGFGTSEAAGELLAMAERAGRRADAVFVTDLDAMYQESRPEPVAQVYAYSEATRQALDDGYSGLRVAADATALVLAPDERSTFLRYEHLVDRAMTSMPFSAMCAYDRTVLGEAVAELACVHPVTNDEANAFGVYATGGQVVGLRGEIDGAVDTLLRTVLSNIPWPSTSPVRIDATRLDFVDHRGLLILAEELQAHSLRATMQTTTHGVARLVDLLDLDTLTVELVP